jgi:hypothetical protein
MNTLRFVSLFFVLIFLSQPIRAELKWDQIIIELHPAGTDKEAVAHFKYRNTGDNTVHFKNVRTSCECTAAKPRKDDVAPGEKGEITATFKFGDRTGFQQKTVIVETDDPAQSSAVLTLKAVVPEALQIRPIFVYWEGGNDTKPKTIMVRASKDFPVKELKVSSSNPDFRTKVETGRAPGEFKIQIEPKQTVRAASATLTIQPDSAARTFYARAQVFSAAAVPQAVPVP